MAEDGKTQYTHTAYSWSADGTDRFTTVYPGENLYLNSKSLEDRYDTNQGAKVTVEPFDSTTNMWHIVSEQGKGVVAGIYFYGRATDMLPDNSYWSYSIDIKGTGVTFKIGINESTRNPVIGTVGSEWSRIVQTGQTDNAKVKTVIMYFDSNSSPVDVYIKLPKLEIGTTPTPYTPSPLDDPEGAFPRFIGTYTDYTVEASTDPSKYTWTKNGVDRSKQVLRIYKGSVRAVDGIIGTKRAAITGLSAGTVVKAGEYQACYVDGVVESKKVDIPGFTVTVPSTTTATAPATTTTTGAKTDTAAITVEA